MECVKVVSLSLIRLALNVHLYGTDTVWRRTCIIHQHRSSASVARGHSIVSMGVLMGPSKPGGNILFSRRGQSPRDGSRRHENLASGFGPSEDPNSEKPFALKLLFGRRWIPSGFHHEIPQTRALHQCTRLIADILRNSLGWLG